MFKPSVKRKLGVSLVVLMLAQPAVFPVNTFAQVLNSERAAQNSEMKIAAEENITLEKAINIVKSVYSIPDNFTNFSSGYTVDNNYSAWELYWSASTGPYGNITARVNTKTGEIVYLNAWKDSANSGLRVPKISENEAQTIADQLLKQLYPAKYNDLKMVDTKDRLISVSPYSPVSYSFYWQRIVNNIPVMGEGVNISINAEDGTISLLNLNWSDSEFASPEGIVSSESAKQSFIQNNLSLKYFQAPLYIIQKEEQKGKVHLVYDINNSALYGAIDAITGKPLSLDKNAYLIADNGPAFGIGKEDAAAGSALTPAEQSEVDEMAKLISKEKAIETVKSVIDIPAELSLTYGNIYYNISTGERIWSLEWSKRANGYDIDVYHYISARVNAVTGELIGFYIYDQSGNEEGKEVISLNQARLIAEDFLKTVQPKRFTQTQLDNEQLKELEEIEKIPANYGQYSFNFKRVVNDIVFSNHNISVTINKYSGKITSYSLNWSDNVEFPAPTNLVSKELAGNNFLNARPLTLSYIKINNGGKIETRLVYIPYVDPYTSNRAEMIDAKYGHLLNSNGNKVETASKVNKFTDIEGLANEKEIRLLGQAGIFGEYGALFKPNENATLISLIKAMYLIQMGGYYGEELSEQDLLAYAKNNGWLKENLTASTVVSRELAAKIFVRMLGYENIAQLKGIFHVPYGDVSEDAKGYVALAKAFGILAVEGDKFNPNQGVSRGELVTMLFKAYSVERK